MSLNLQWPPYLEDKGLKKAGRYAFPHRNPEVLWGDNLVREIEEILEENHLTAQSLRQIQEDNAMDKEYGTDTHDKIFEAIMDDAYITVDIRYANQSKSNDMIYSYRVPATMEIEEGDFVILEAGKGVLGGNSYGCGMTIGRVEGINDTKSEYATAWVVQKVDLSPHFERQEQWKAVYAAIRETEMTKKKAVVADNYLGEVEKYAPQHVALLKGLGNSSKLLTSDSSDDES